MSRKRHLLLNAAEERAILKRRVIQKKERILDERQRVLEKKQQIELELIHDRLAAEMRCVSGDSPPSPRSLGGEPTAKEQNECCIGSNALGKTE